MAARTRKIRHDDETRAKIKASQLINRLTDHVLGKVELQTSQVNAALGLLKKVLPDLASVSGEVDHHHYGLRDVLSEVDGSTRGLPGEEAEAGSPRTLQ